MTTPQTIEQHAHALCVELGMPDNAMPAILTALTAYGVACAEAMRADMLSKYPSGHHGDCGWEDCLKPMICTCGYSDLSDPLAVIKGMGHG